MTERTKNLLDIILVMIDPFSYEERQDLFNHLGIHFCLECGSKQDRGQPCQCWNDE
jgi:hypothetical protein